MKILYNPSSASALSSAPADDNITFDLPAQKIYARGQTFSGTDKFVQQDNSTTTAFRPIVLGYTSYASMPNSLASTTNKVYVSSKIYVNPNAGSLYASKLYSGGKEVLTQLNPILFKQIDGTTVEFNGTSTVDLTSGLFYSKNTLFLYWNNKPETGRYGESTWRNGVEDGKVVWGLYWGDSDIGTDTGVISLWINGFGNKVNEKYSQTNLNMTLDGYVTARGFKTLTGEGYNILLDNGNVISKSNFLTAGNYVTLDTNQTITGYKNFSTGDSFTYSGISTGTDDVDRKIWFSHSSAEGRPVVNDNFKYNPYTQRLLIKYIYCPKIGGLYLTDLKEKQYGAIVDNGANLWIGQAGSNLLAHTGATYISTGLTRNDDGTFKSGNATIKIAIPTSESSQDYADLIHTKNWSSIKLIGYTIGNSVSKLLTSDTLSAALGKLEFRTKTLEEWLSATNPTDTTIDRLQEVFNVLSGINDTDTIQAIIGKYLPLTGGKLTGSLIIQKNVNTNDDVTLRFTEEKDSYLGGFINYEGINNYLYIGTHDVSNSDVANDINAIQITRKNGKVAILTSLSTPQLTITDTEAAEHIKFSKKVTEKDAFGINYITFPSEGFLGISTSAATANIIAIFENSDSAITFRPYYNEKGTLGTATRKWNNIYSKTLNGNTLTLNAANGTSPMSITSTTKVDNLNADLLDGYHASSLFSKLENDNNLLSITIGGINKKLTVDYSNIADSASCLQLSSIKNVSLNTFTDKKFIARYATGTNNLQNIPDDETTGQGFGLLSFGTAGGYLAQILTSTSSNIYFRILAVNDDTSNNWQKIITSNNFSTYAISKLYWANVLVSNSPNSSTLPTFLNATVTNNATINEAEIIHTLKINSTSGEKHLEFSRSSYNYIIAPEDGKIAFATDNAIAKIKTLINMENGYVGLGTTDPKLKLDIVGNIRLGNSLDDVILYFWRGTELANWKIRNSKGTLHFEYNWVNGSAQEDYVDALKLECNTGNATFKNYVKAYIFNSSAATETLETISDVFVTNGSDNYIRKTSFLNFLSKLKNSEIITITKQLTVTQGWIDTGITGDNLNQGTYILLLYTNSSANGLNEMYYSGIMSWYSSNTNSGVQSDEIVLHSSGKSNSSRLYLKTVCTNDSNVKLKLQISASKDLAKSDYVFKFRKMI